MFKLDCLISPELQLLVECLVKRPSLPMENQEEFCSALCWTESLPKISFVLSCKHATSLHCFIVPFWISWELRWFVHCTLRCVRYCPLTVCILLQISFSTDWKKHWLSLTDKKALERIWRKMSCYDFTANSLDDIYSKKLCLAKIHMDKNLVFSFWINFDKVQMQYMLAMKLSSAWLIVSKILQVAVWLFQTVTSLLLVQLK